MTAPPTYENVELGTIRPNQTQPPAPAHAQAQQPARRPAPASHPIHRSPPRARRRSSSSTRDIGGPDGCCCNLPAPWYFNIYMCIVFIIFIGVYIHVFCNRKEDLCTPDGTPTQLFRFMELTAIILPTTLIAGGMKVSQSLFIPAVLNGFWCQMGDRRQ